MELTSYNKPCVSRSKEVSSYISSRVNPCILWLNLRIGDFQLPWHFMPGHRVDEGTWGRSIQIQHTEAIHPLQRKVSLHWLLRKDRLGWAKQQYLFISYEFANSFLAILVFDNWRGASKKEARSWGDLVDERDKQLRVQCYFTGMLLRITTPVVKSNRTSG